MPPILYMTEMSPPSRAVMLTIEELALDVEIINMDFRSNDHLKPDFIKKNPQHTIPTLEDGDFIVWDSHAIVVYLASAYGSHKPWMLPKCIKMRAIIDQRMHFDSMLFEILRNAVYPLYCNMTDTIPQRILDEIMNKFKFMDIFLTNNEFLCGQHMTVADFCNIATVSTLTEFIPIEESKFPNLHRWLTRLSKLPYYESANAAGARALGDVVKSKLTTFVPRKT